MNNKLIALFIVIVGLIVAIMLAVQVGQGEFQTVYISMVLIFSIPIFLLLGLRTWYLLPFAMLAELPAIPLFAGRSISLAEMVVTMFSGLMVLAVIQGRKNFKIRIADWWPMLIYGGWVILIALINGGGLAILGAEAVGGRRYLTVIIAVVGMMMLSQMSIRDKEAKKVCYLLFSASALTGVYTAISTFIGYRAVGGATSFYSWQQGLSLISLGGVFLMFARFSPSNIIKSPWKVAAYILLLAICMFSGKRMAFAGCCVIPIIACFWHREVIVAMAVIMLGSLSIMGAVIVQNYVTPIPLQFQRVIAFIPADWSREVEDSTNDIFRETLNRWAIINIKENPVIGEGVSLTADDFSLMNDLSYVYQIKFHEDDPQAFPHIAGKNWHSTWLGLSASFGIPCAVAWVFLQIFVLKRSWSLGHVEDLSVWPKSLMAMVFFFMFFGVMRSLSSGDVAILAMGGGLFIGLVCAVNNGLRDDRWYRARQQ